MILVVGATGMVGTHLVAKLEARGMAVRAGTRGTASDAQGLGTLPGTRTTRTLFDFERPQTFGPALERVDRVFLMGRPGEQPEARSTRTFIDEMKRRGIQHVVNLSTMGADLPSVAPALRAVEQHLEDSGLPFTHLRPNLMMQMFSSGPLLTSIKTANTLPIPAGLGRISFVDARDVAAAAEAALIELKHVNQTYTLTGREALDHTEVALHIERASGHKVQSTGVDEGKVRLMLLSQGASQEQVERLFDAYSVVRPGSSASVCATLQTLLGRPPTAFDQFARDHRFVWS